MATLWKSSRFTTHVLWSVIIIRYKWLMIGLECVTWDTAVKKAKHAGGHIVFILFRCVFFFVCSSLPLALSPHPRSVSTIPSQQYSSPLMCVLAFVYPRECVCVPAWVIWGFGWAECLSSLHSESISLRCFNTGTTMVFFFNTWYYAIVLYDSLVSKGALWGRK